jgi:hypothetical protein
MREVLSIYLTTVCGAIGLRDSSPNTVRVKRKIIEAMFMQIISAPGKRLVLN